jgi:hypothetical protein
MQSPSGYSAPGREIVVQGKYDEETVKSLRETSQDYKESFESGREDDPVMPNIWPPENVLPGFRQACLDFYWVCNSYFQKNRTSGTYTAASDVL